MFSFHGCVVANIYLIALNRHEDVQYLFTQILVQKNELVTVINCYLRAEGPDEWGDSLAIRSMSQVQAIKRQNASGHIFDTVL